MAEKQPTFTFSGFTVEQVNIVLSALKELPYKVSADLVHGITAAAEAQLKEFNESLKDPKTVE